MAKQKISREMFELHKSLCTGKRARNVGFDEKTGEPIYVIEDYDVTANLLEQFEVVDE